MAAKKYLSLEEAASLLKIKTEELIRLREKGEIRGFADRGTWKFKDGDVEEFLRRRQPDSDPDVAIMDDDDDELGRQATVIRKGSSSDSDVRLVLDKDLKSRLTGSSAELPVLDPAKSDSDVKLLSGSGPRLRSDSDSDVKLVNPLPQEPDSDSDVKLVDPPKRRLTDSDSDVRLAQSDSDVKLVKLKDSDSDVKLIDHGARGKSSMASDSDVALLPAHRTDSLDFDVTDSSESGSALFDDDPGISLPGESGIQLGRDSGIRLGGDSGLRLGGDSGIRLTHESGISLQQPLDSGILLEGDSGLVLGHGDSSITLSDDSGMKLRGSPSNKKLKGGSSTNMKGRGRAANDLDATAPMLLARDRDEPEDLGATAPMLLQHDDDDLDATLDIPLLSGDDDQTETSVIMFDDDEDADQSSATVVKKGRKSVDESMFDLDDEGEADELGDDDELEVSDEVLGEDDELEDLDAFDSDEDEFDEGFESGASRIGFANQAGKIAAPQEAEWGTGFFVSLLVSCVMLLVGALISVDLLRTTWAGENTVYQGELIDSVGGLFSK